MVTLSSWFSLLASLLMLLVLVADLDLFLFVKGVYCLGWFIGVMPAFDLFSLCSFSSSYHPIAIGLFCSSLLTLIWIYVVLYLSTAIAYVVDAWLSVNCAITGL